MPCIFCLANLPHAQHITALQAAKLGLIVREVLIVQQPEPEKPKS